MADEHSSQPGQPANELDRAFAPVSGTARTGNLWACELAQAAEGAAPAGAMGGRASAGSRANAGISLPSVLLLVAAALIAELEHSGLGFGLNQEREPSPPNRPRFIST